MRPIYINLTPAQAVLGYVSDPIVLDQYVAPGNATVTLSVKNAGSLTALLEFTTDNVLDPSSNGGPIIWQPFTATPFDTSGRVTIPPTGVGPAAAIAALAYVPKAVRVSIVGNAPVGSPQLSIQVVQLGMTGT